MDVCSSAKNGHSGPFFEGFPCNPFTNADLPVYYRTWLTPNVAKYSAFFSRKPKANVTKQKDITMQQIFRIQRVFCKELWLGSSSSSFIQQGKDAFISPMSFLSSKDMFNKKSLTFTSFFISLSEVIKCMTNKLKILTIFDTV